MVGTVAIVAAPGKAKDEVDVVCRIVVLGFDLFVYLPDGFLEALQVARYLMLTGTGSHLYIDAQLSALNVGEEGAFDEATSKEAYSDGH